MGLDHAERQRGRRRLSRRLKRSQINRRPPHVLDQLLDIDISLGLVVCTGAWRTLSDALHAV